MSDNRREHRYGGDRSSRSRSPRTSHRHSHRSRSPRRHHHHHHHSTQSTREVPRDTILPFGARSLVKGDYSTFKPMFALYLDIQKGKILDELESHEQKGRWKSFVKKWNSGELAEGWYDPSTLQKATEDASSYVEPGGYAISGAKVARTSSAIKDEPIHDEEGSDSDESVGPALPGQPKLPRSNRAGPSVPGIVDLELKRDLEVQAATDRREDERFAKTLYRKQQKEAMDEIAPRAEAGTRERQLEKKKELNEKMKSFRERSPGGEEVADSALMGGGDDLASYKKQKQEMERKKNERELRKEEIMRARAAEREERLADYKQKEAATVEMLKALAKQRFG